MPKTSPEENLENFRTVCIEMATGKGEFSYERYERSRLEVIQDVVLLRKLPDWVIEGRYGSEYWAFVSSQGSTYAARRKFLNSEFDEISKRVASGNISPTKWSVESILEDMSLENINSAWEKCYLRRIEDPEGAITSARTLLESTCKYIIEDLGEKADESGELQRLYKQPITLIGIAPSHASEQIFKQIMSGISTIVDGLAGIRNKLSDSHGKGINIVRADQRHSEFVVSLAGSLSVFLHRSYLESKP